MSITLDLPQDLQSELSAEAAKLGLPLSEYALSVILTRRTRGGTVPQTGAELVTYWQREGVIGTRGDIANSREHVRQLRQQAERRVPE